MILQLLKVKRLLAHDVILILPIFLYYSCQHLLLAIVLLAQLIRHSFNDLFVQKIVLVSIIFILHDLELCNACFFL